MPNAKATIEVEVVCQEYDPKRNPRCLKTPDPAYTMDFSDIGQEPIHFCSHCGPEAHEVTQVLELWLLTGNGASLDDGKVAKLEKLISEAEEAGRQARS